jgi:hypothetical protein
MYGPPNRYRRFEHERSVQGWFQKNSNNQKARRKEVSAEILEPLETEQIFLGHNR